MGNRMASVPLSNSGQVPEFFEETDLRDGLCCRFANGRRDRFPDKVPSC